MCAFGTKVLSTQLPKKLQDYVDALEEKQRVYKCQEAVFEQKVLVCNG